jgi:hypothetical protein
LGIARVVFGLPALDGLHRESMAEDEREPFVGPEVGKPVPGEQACDRHDKLVTIRRTSRAEGLRASFHVPVQQDFARLVQDTDVHAAGMQVDAAVKLVLCVVEAPEILCRRTGHTHGAIVKLLKAAFTKKERSHDYRNPDPHCA